MWRMVPGPWISHNTIVAPALIRLNGDPFRPILNLPFALPPLPFAPVGFSEDIERDSRPVLRILGG